MHWQTMSASHSEPNRSMSNVQFPWSRIAASSSVEAMPAVTIENRPGRCPISTRSSASKSRVEPMLAGPRAALTR